MSTRTPAQWVADEQLVYVWEDDRYMTVEHLNDADKAYVREHGAVECLLYRPCAEHGIHCPHAVILASLSGIVESLDPQERDDYRRVVEAQLAAEAQRGAEA